MANALDILGELIQNGMTKSGKDRVRNALGEGDQGSLGGLLEQFGKQVGVSTESGGGLLDSLAKMAKGALNDPKGAVKGGNPVAIGGLGALAGALLGNPSGAAKGALGAGALALLASLAKSALSGKEAQAEQQSFSDVHLGLRAPENAAEEKELQSRADLLVLAMINAAKADGVIDQSELDRISGRLQETGADAEAVSYVREELHKPLDLLGLIKAVPDQEAGVQVYAASLLATEADTEAERDYLDRLAGGLDLDRSTVAYVHKTLGVA